ncbi:MAG: hypothetical protein H0U52_06075 [Chloroflexi bacterium]|nr:hypothetical protein [Chloroflexota bacterium]
MPALTRAHRRALPIGFLAMVLCGCLAEGPLPSPVLPAASASPLRSATPAASPSVLVVPNPTPVPTPTPEPTLPAAALQRSATLERDGIRITMELGRNPLPAGEATWVTTKLTNLGPGPLVWAADCQVPLWVFGTMPGTGWRYGGAQAVPDLEFKSWALDRIINPDVAGLQMGFLPEGLRRQGIELGEFGCGDVFQGRRLAAGKSIVGRARWGGGAMFVAAPLPQGRLRLRTAFDTWWRGADDNVRGEPLVLEMDAWVAGAARPVRIDPGEAVDIALAHPEFRAWLLSRPHRNGADTVVKFDPAKHVWRVGLTSYNPTIRTRVAVIDADSGAILDIVGPLE